MNRKILFLRLRLLRDHVLECITLAILVLLTFIYFFPRMVVTIYPGQAGVLWDRFYGTRLNLVYGEGVHIVAPWNALYIYDVRLQQNSSEYEVISKSGLSLRVVASVRYRPAGAPFAASINRGVSAENSLPELHKNIGPDYRDKIVLPLVGSVLRQVIGHYTAEELYRLNRHEIEDKIVEVMADRRNREQFADERYVDVVDVLISDVTLPPAVRDAIDKKMVEEQNSLAFDFTLRTAQKEAERKAIEAEGIRRFQQTVNQGITPSYLQWKGIEATLELAKSPNSKVVVIGGKDGLPLILNTDSAGGVTAGALPKTPTTNPAK